VPLSSLCFFNCKLIDYCYDVILSLLLGRFQAFRELPFDQRLSTLIHSHHTNRTQTSILKKRTYVSPVQTIQEHLSLEVVFNIFQFPGTFRAYIATGSIQGKSSSCALTSATHAGKYSTERGFHCCTLVCAPARTVAQQNIQ
jgi:hypothetical protein